MPRTHKGEGAVSSTTDARKTEYPHAKE